MEKDDSKNINNFMNNLDTMICDLKTTHSVEKNEKNGSLPSKCSKEIFYATKCL